MLRCATTRALPALVALAFLPAVQAQAAEPVVSGADARTRLELTIYNQDLALVREVRDVALPAGVATVEFRDVPARIDATSLRIDGGDGFTLLEQNYEYDLLSRSRILEKYVGRDLAWLQDDGSRIEGTLLGMNDGPVFRVDGGIVFDVPGRLQLPALPADLRDRPTLVWRVEGDKGRTRQIDASYLTGGIGWHADYILDLDAAGRRAGLQAWVTLDNRSGASYRDAVLRLVAGDIHRAAEPPRPEYMVAMADAAGRAKGFTEQAMYDYHLYTLGRPTDLKDRQVKQISLFERDGVPVERRYRLPPDRGFGRGDADGAVEVSYHFINSEKAGLGVPMPAGVVRVYGAADGGRQLLGEDRLGHTPRDEQVGITVGNAFDVVGERVVVSSERVGSNGERRKVRVTLRNHKTEDITVEVDESVWGDWDVKASTLPARRVSATELAFDAPVPAGAETVVEYTVEINR